MRNGGGVLLAVRNSCVGIRMRLVTFDGDRFVTDSTQTVNHCFTAAVQSVSTARCVRRNDQLVDRFEVSH
jgi:hypothetical protein